jgi:hypothetical protein
MLSSRNVTVPRDDYFKDVKQQGVATKVMHSVWSASVLGNVNEIKQGATTRNAFAENRWLHCKEQTLVTGTVSPCKDHGRYASVRDANKDLIQTRISPKLGKYVRPSYAARKGDSFCTIAEKKLHKPQEKNHHEKEKKLTGRILLSPKQREEVSSTANESNEEVPIDGLNLLVKKDENTNNVAAQKGQRWSVFQSECKIKDKVCKLVIDGGSFTNMISKDLVQRLSLSTWRHPTPHHIKWMNPTRKLKIIHKVRVKFSFGSYIDKVECDVVPMNVCHLLLGRPWEYDLNATYEGRSNHYSFVHKGMHHLLKPMLECAINAEVFPTITMKKNSDIGPKWRTTLFQGAEDFMSISNATIGISVSNASTIDAADASKNPCKGSNILSINFAKSDANQFGSIVAEIMDEANFIVDTKTTICAVVCKNEASTHMSKLRTAFFKEGEDDEPMDHQIITATYSENKHDAISISKGDVLENCSI